MNPLPYDSFLLHTTTPVGVLKERLEKHVFHLGEDMAGKLFAGEVTRAGFTLYRLRGGPRNGGRPTLCVRLEGEAGGTRVRVRMRPVWFSILFLLCWFGFCCAMVVGDARLHGLRPVTVLAPAGIFLFAYGLIWTGFWSEAAEAKRTLTDVLNTDEVSR